MSGMRTAPWLAWALAVVVTLTSLAQSSTKALPKPKAVSLFDGKTLAGWKVSDYGGTGEVFVEGGSLHLVMGEPFTGISFTGKLPTNNYELSLEAMREDGNDFFCGLTFPVGESACTLVVGGWGGGLVGLSSLDGLDASDNETGKWRELDSKRWYQVRLRVTDTHIQAWIDMDKVVDVATKGRKISIRPDVQPSKPMGIATWRTSAALRNIRMQSIEKAESEKKAK